MTPGEVLSTVEKDQGESVDDVADRLYLTVKSALDGGESRESLYRALQDAHARLGAAGLSKERKAVAQVLATFEGFSSPQAAL